MLFPYVFVAHQMDKMQGYIDFIFYEVWCKADGKEYDIDVLFAANAELREMITELHTNENRGADFFLTGLQQLFEDFKTLTDEQIEKLKLWYRSNNDIEGLCRGNHDLEPATYEDVTAEISEDFSNHLKAFCKNLYSQRFLSLKSVKDRIGNISGHYHDFTATNIHGKCPFCGISDILTGVHKVRDAYDHYLPKDKYPFNSINFHNLAPTCHTCNSGYKTSKNTLFSNAGKRRKAFYPFSSDHYTIELSISINAADWTSLSKNDIQIAAGPASLRDEIATWFAVYGIEERYQLKCCAEHDGMDWIREVVDESSNFDQCPKQYLQGKLKTAENQPWADNNFLRKPFLKACEQHGIFD